MITAWRITKTVHAARAFDGEGARIAGGRWTSPGLPLVYTAENAALAALEVLVHFDVSVRPAYVLIPCAFPSDIVLRLDRRRLPGQWRAYPAPAALQQLGDAWVRSGASAVLEVPSVVIDSQSNFLLNPAHRDFSKVTAGKPVPFDFDPRLLKVKARGLPGSSLYSLVRLRRSRSRSNSRFSASSWSSSSPSS